MKLLRKIQQEFNDVYCFLGVHQWVLKPETFDAKFEDRNRTITLNRHYRICTNCYKCQHNGVGIMRNNWSTESDVELNFRSKEIRRIKLNKLIITLS